MADAIYQAKAKKDAVIKTQEYSRQLLQPRSYPKFTYEELDKFIRLKFPKLVIDENNKVIYEILCQYFSGDKAFEMQGEGFSLDKGIMLYGPVGCGKTFLMKAFQLNTFRPFAIHGCRIIADEYASDGANSLYRYSEMQPAYPQQNYGHEALGRCFDDLGTEDNKSNFGNKVNVMQDIFYKIYDNDVIGNFHVTTNLTGDEIDAHYGKRIRSRMRELFNVIPFDEYAPDRRS